MATHSTILPWRIPGTGECDGLPSMGLHRVGHDLAAAACTYIGIYIYSPTCVLMCEAQPTTVVTTALQATSITVTEHKSNLFTCAYSQVFAYNLPWTNNDVQ